MRSGQKSNEELPVVESNPPRVGSFMKWAADLVTDLEEALDAMRMLFEESREEVKEILLQVGELEKELAARPKKSDFQRMKTRHENRMAELRQYKAENHRLGKIDGERITQLEKMRAEVQDLNLFKQDAQGKINLLKQKLKDSEAISEKRGKKVDELADLNEAKDININDLQRLLNERGEENRKLQADLKKFTEQPTITGGKPEVHVEKPKPAPTYIPGPGKDPVPMICLHCGHWGGNDKPKYHVGEYGITFGQCLHNAELKEGAENETRYDERCEHWIPIKEEKKEKRSGFMPDPPPRPRPKKKRKEVKIGSDDS